MKKKKSADKFDPKMGLNNNIVCTLWSTPCCRPMALSPRYKGILPGVIISRFWSDFSIDSTLCGGCHSPICSFFWPLSN